MDEHQAKLLRIEFLAAQAVEHTCVDDRSYDPGKSKWSTIHIPVWIVLQLKALLEYEGRFDDCDPPCMIDAFGGSLNEHGQPWGG